VRSREDLERLGATGWQDARRLGMRLRERDISRSMVALVASLTALALLGLATTVPGWIGRGEGFVDVPPGLLKVEADAKGVATLGGGVTVSLYSDGLRVSRDSSLLLQTVIGGSMLSAVEGSATTNPDGDTQERVTHQYDNVTINDLVFLPGTASYFGTVGDGTRSLPLTIRIEAAGSVVRVGASVNGADGVVWHLNREPLTVGIRPGLPATNLRKTALWVDPGAVEGRAVFSTLLGTDVGVGPQRVARGVDIRQGGRTDIHVWTDGCFLTVSSQARHSPTSTSTS
jgi:hypothetical protein